MHSLTLTDMVGSIISSALGGAMQVGSAIYGQIKSNQLNKQAERELQNRRAENKQWYEQKMNEDYMNRSDVQNVLRKQRELLGEQYQRARATNLVAGGTDESLALQQQAANTAMGDTMANIAANASAYKDNIEQQYRAQENNLSQQQQQIYSNQANAVAQAASQAAQTGGNLLVSGLEGITKVKKVNA
jgi:hypothetical protein